MKKGERIFRFVICVIRWDGDIYKVRNNKRFVGFEFVKMFLGDLCGIICNIGECLFYKVTGKIKEVIYVMFSIEVYIL